MGQQTILIVQPSFMISLSAIVRNNKNTRPKASCFHLFLGVGYPDETLALVLQYLKDTKDNRLHLGQKYLGNKPLQAAGMSADNACFGGKCESLRTICHSPGHNQKWMYDFLYSDWLTGNQNIAQTAKGLRPREKASAKKSIMSAGTSHNKLQQ